MSNSRLLKLLEMLQNQPEDAFLLYATGFEYESVGDVPHAIEHYTKILDIHPDYLPVYYQAGLFYAGIGQKEKGISLLEKGIELAKVQNDKKTLRELIQALADLNDD